MNVKRMTERTREAITNAVHEVDSLVKNGDGPTEAFAKIASRDGLSPAQIQHAASAYNVGATMRWMESKSGSDRASSFPIVDVDTVLAQVFPGKVEAPQIKKAASVSSASTVSDSAYTLPEDTRALEKYASAPIRARAFYTQRLTDEEVHRRVSSSRAHFRKSAAECGRRAQDLDLDAMSLAHRAETLMKKMASHFDLYPGEYTPFLSLAKQASNTAFEIASAVADYFDTSLKVKKTAAVRAFRSEAVAEMLDEATAISEGAMQRIRAAETFRKFASVMHKVAAPFDPDPDPTKYQGVHLMSDIARYAPSQPGIALRAGYTPYLLKGMQSTGAQLAAMRNYAYNPFADPEFIKAKNEAEGLMSTVSLYHAIAADPVLRNAPLNDIAHAYSTVFKHVPRIRRNPALLASTLRYAIENPDMDMQSILALISQEAELDRATPDSYADGLTLAQQRSKRNREALSSELAFAGKKRTEPEKNKNKNTGKGKGTRGKGK